MYLVLALLKVAFVNFTLNEYMMASDCNWGDDWICTVCILHWLYCFSLVLKFLSRCVYQISKTNDIVRI